MKLNMKDLMKQAKAMQEQMQRKQEELASQTFEATAGGGMVTVKVNGKHEVISLKIDPTIVSADDVGMLEDLVTAAVNEAFRQVDKTLKDSLGDMMGPMGGLGGLL